MNVSVGDDTAPRTEWNDVVFNQLIASPSFISTYVPSVSLLLAMLSYLGGIGVVTWLWQRRRLAPRRLLIMLLSLATVSTVAGYAYFSHGGNVPDGVLLSSLSHVAATLVPVPVALKFPEARSYGCVASS